MSTSSAPGLRERKKAETRAALVRAAQELVLEHGLDSTTVDAICTRADVSRRTFFNYFQTKDEAVLGMRGEDEIIPAAVRDVFVAGGPTGQFGDDLVELVRGVLSAKVMTREDVRRRHEVMVREPALLGHQVASFGRLERTLTALMSERSTVAPLPVDPSLAAVASIGLVRAAFTLWQRADGDDDVGAHLDPAREQLAAAFVSPTPR